MEDWERAVAQCTAGKARFRAAVHQYVCRRFRLAGDTDEENLYRLAVASIRQAAPELPQRRVEELLAGPDCHQTTYAMQKKILMILELERVAGVTLAPETADAVQTTGQCADAIYALRHRERSGHV